MATIRYLLIATVGSYLPSGASCTDSLLSSLTEILLNSSWSGSTACSWLSELFREQQQQTDQTSSAINASESTWLERYTSESKLWGTGCREKREGKQRVAGCKVLTTFRKRPKWGAWMQLHSTTRTNVIFAPVKFHGRSIALGPLFTDAQRIQGCAKCTITQWTSCKNRNN